MNAVATCVKPSGLCSAPRFDACEGHSCESDGLDDVFDG